MEDTKVDKFVLDSREVNLEKPTHEVEVKTAEFGGLNISVGVVDARENSSDRTIIMPLSYDSRLIDTKSASSVEIPRLQVIAEACKARVIGVEQPGVGVSEEANMPFVRQLQMVVDRYNWSAKQMLGAMNEVVDFEKNETVEFLGYAQGAAVGAAMVNAMTENPGDNELRIDRMMIVEPVNDQWRWIKNTLDDTQIEVNQGKHHFADNEKYDWLSGPADKELEAKADMLREKQSGTVLKTGAALLRAFSPVLIDAIKSDLDSDNSAISEAKFDFVKFENSRISRPESMKKTARQILNATPLARVAFHNIVAAPGQKELRLEAFQSMPNVKQLFEEKGPLA